MIRNNSENLFNWILNYSPKTLITLGVKASKVYGNICFPISHITCWSFHFTDYSSQHNIGNRKLHSLIVHFRSISCFQLIDQCQLLYKSSPTVQCKRELVEFFDSVKSSLNSRNFRLRASIKLNFVRSNRKSFVHLNSYRAKFQKLPQQEDVSEPSQD